MNKATYIYGLTGFLTSSAIAGLLIAGKIQAQSPGPGQDLHHPSQATPSPNRMMTTQIDQHFIQMMIPHHEEAIRMADLALSRAKRPEVKKLAIAIKTDQSREIQEMRTWYKRWYGTDVPAATMAGMGMMGTGQGVGMSMLQDRMGMEMDEAALKQASDFDQEFIRQMIPHHRMAVMMAQMVLNSATHPEVRSLAQSIIKTQLAEINQMQQWYQTWYR